MEYQEALRLVDATVTSYGHPAVPGSGPGVDLGGFVSRLTAMLVAKGALEIEEAIGMIVEVGQWGMKRAT